MINRTYSCNKGTCSLGLSQQSVCTRLIGETTNQPALFPVGQCRVLSASHWQDFTYIQAIQRDGAYFHMHVVDEL